MRGKTWIEKRKDSLQRDRKLTTKKHEKEKCGQLGQKREKTYYRTYYTSDANMNDECSFAVALGFIRGVNFGVNK